MLVPHKVAESLGFDENSTVEITEAQGSLIITKKLQPSTLQELLDSIPKNFQYPDDVANFLESKPVGQELL